MWADLADKLQEGRHFILQRGPVGLVQVEADAQAQQPVLLIVRVQHVHGRLHELHPVRPQRLIMRQPVHGHHAYCVI